MSDEKQEKQEQQEPKSARELIYESRARQVIEEREEAMSGDDVDRAQAEQLETFAGGTGETEPEAKAEPAGDENEEPATGEGEEPERRAPLTMEALAKELASGAESVKIRAYGQEQAVTREAVLDAARIVLKDKEVSDEKRLEAGLRELSKHHAADVRLAQAKDYERRLKDWYEKLQKETSVPAAGPAPSSDAQPETGQTPTPVSDQPPSGAGEAELKELTGEIVGALYAGRREEAEEAMTALLSKVRGSAQPQIDIEALTEQVRRDVEKDLEQKTRQQMVEDANAVFESEFHEIYVDDVLFAAAQARANQLSEDPEWSKKPLTDIAREAGNYVSDLFKLSPPSTDVDEQLEERRSLKEVRPKPPQARGRGMKTSLESDQPPKKFPTAGEYVRSLQKQRGAR